MHMEVHEKKTLNLDNIYYDEEGCVVFGKGCIKEPVVCLRPGHKSGVPQIYAEIKNDKLISHNYGHSGVGWSLLFGTIEKAIENFEKIRCEDETTFTDEITILGLGCVGLVTAITLYQRGYKNIKLIGEKFNSTPSFMAGGLIEFSLSTIFDNEHLDYINSIFKYTFGEYQHIVAGTHKFVREGVKEVDYYTDYFQENAGLSYLSNIGMIPKMKKVHLKLGDNSERELYHFRTFNIDTTSFMNGLFSTVKKLKIPVEIKKINLYDEVKSKIIFNCTGFGSKELNNDINCYPICGHGVVLADEKIADHGYILRLGSVPELMDHESAGPLYFMPKSSGFIGGTYMKGYDGKDEKLNKELITKLLVRSKFIFNGIKPFLKPKF